MQGRFSVVQDVSNPEEAQKRLARGNSVASLVDKSAAPSATALLPSLKVLQLPYPFHLASICWRYFASRTP